MGLVEADRAQVSVTRCAISGGTDEVLPGIASDGRACVQRVVETSWQHRARRLPGRTAHAYPVTPFSLPSGAISTFMATLPWIVPSQ
jgi:hypothetical protein